VSSNPRCEKMVRITVGKPEENNALYTGIRELLNQV
jgi:histidinol-phosphate/aromatic aminotransferase/cobyric acid decarboxylase-like protein